MAAALWKEGTSNAFSTTLDGNITLSDTSITLTTATGLQSPGIIVIDRIDNNGNATPTVREYVSYTGISTNTLTGCSRGLGGSSAQSHSSAAIVEEVLSVDHWNDLLSALLNVLTSAGALDTTKVADLATAQTLTNKTITYADNTLTNVVGTTATQTLTNKRVTPRVSTEASSATPTINTDNVDMHTITALGTAVTSFTTNLSGTPTNGQKLIIRILDDGTARAITWGTSFASRGADLPTTTTASKYLYVGLIYNSTASKWDCVAAVEED
jgi:hypothetical protein